MPLVEKLPPREPFKNVIPIEQAERAATEMQKLGCNSTSCFHLADCFKTADLNELCEVMCQIGEVIRIRDYGE